MDDEPDAAPPTEGAGRGAPTPEGGSTTGRRRRGRRIGAGVGIGLLVIVAILLTVAFTPLFEWRIRSGAQPAADYEQAMAKARELLADEGEGVNPVCRSRVLDQGQRSAKSVVLLHGFTNCPKQFDVIADAYAAAGYSVVIPRLPGHGKSDRLTKDLSDITPQALADSGNRAVDIAAGLGEQVEVVGLSGGGTVAAYLAHERDEVTEAVLIAPLVIPRVLPEFAVAPVARLFRVVPDVYLWWDSAQKDALATPPYAYPRYSLRALGAFLALGRRVQNTDPGRATGLDRLVVVTNANDAAVNAAGVADIADAVAVSAGQRIDHLFPASEGFKHDIIDPRGENADKLAQIYPTLGQLLGLQDLRAPMRP